MGRYSLTRAAAADFEGIFEYSLDSFGSEQAVQYQNGLKHRIEDLADNPERYPIVDHIREGYRRSIFKSHAIYYRVDGDGVLVVRILGRQSAEEAL